MRSIYAALILAALLATPAAWPARIIGNGGDVVVCTDPMAPVQLLDFVEARILRRRSINLTDPGGANYTNKLGNLYVKIQKRFPRLAEVILADIIHFEQKNVKEPGIELEDIDDSYHKIRLKNCHLEQIANQSIPMFEDDPWFLISYDLWVRLSELHKAGLVLHEVLYRLGLKYGVEHSIGIRYLVGLLFNDDLNRTADKDWIEAFRHSRIKNYETGGIQFPLFTAEEKVCSVVPGTVQCLGGTPVISEARIDFTPEQRVRTVKYDSMEDVNFEFPDFSASLRTSQFYLQWRPDGTAGVLTEGRMTMTKGSKVDVMMMDVSGMIDPVTSQFSGRYRMVRDRAVEQVWQAYKGKLTDLWPSRTYPNSSGFFRRNE